MLLHSFLIAAAAVAVVVAVVLLLLLLLLLVDLLPASVSFLANYLWRFIAAIATMLCY